MKKGLIQWAYEGAIATGVAAIALAALAASGGVVSANIDPYPDEEVITYCDVDDVGYCKSVWSPCTTGRGTQGSCRPSRNCPCT
jgi:hypothetical protein